MNAIKTQTGLEQLQAIREGTAEPALIQQVLDFELVLEVRGGER